MAAMAAELDTGIWIVAAHRYVRLRRRYWRFFFGAFLVGLLMACLTGALDPAPEGAASAVLGCVAVVGFLACWVGALVSWIGLIRFECPRCEGSFVMTWWGSWPGNRCKHCGLDLRAAAMAEE